mmetsp:Transcript_35103/g.85755  ORF Transcript_35103/g.85755 Transcript_35103/m.85755 type:complete len:122 (+) Transcript_35103:73-438(+)
MAVSRAESPARVPKWLGPAAVQYGDLLLDEWERELREDLSSRGLPPSRPTTRDTARSAAPSSMGDTLRALEPTPMREVFREVQYAAVKKPGLVLPPRRAYDSWRAPPSRAVRARCELDQGQ